QIDAHGGGDLFRIPGRAQIGLLGFFLEPVHAMIAVDIDDAEAGDFVGRDLNGGQRNIGGRVVVLLEHLAVVHLVDVVARENEHVLGLLGSDGVDVLVNRVGGAHVPVVAYALHGRQDFDELAHLAGNDAPALADVTVQR